MPVSSPAAPGLAQSPIHIDVNLQNETCSCQINYKCKKYSYTVKLTYPTSVGGHDTWNNFFGI